MLDFLILVLQETILQSSYLISANFSISSQQLPSHTNKATVAGTREEEKKGVIQEEGKGAAVLCPGHSGEKWFFFPILWKTPKQNGRTDSVRTTSDGRK